MSFETMIIRHSKLIIVGLVALLLGSVAAQSLAATTVQGSATLTWIAPTENEDGTPVTDLTHYTIYIGTTSGVYTSQLKLTDPKASSTTFTVPVTEGKSTLYFAMTASDAKGNESEKSNEVSKVFNIDVTDILPPKPPALQKANLELTCTTGQEPSVTCTVTVVQ